MKRHGGNLEREAGQDEHEAEQNADIRMIMHRLRDRGEGDRAGIAVDERRAVKQHARRQRAEHEILEARFGGAQIMAAIGGDYVERQAHQFEAEIERDEIVGRDQHQHAERANEDEDREFEAADPLLAHELGGQHHRHQRADERERAHEAGEGVIGEGAVEGDAHRAILGDQHNENDAEETDRDLGDEIGRPLAAQRAVKHERQCPRRQHRFGQDHGKRKGRLVHKGHSFKGKMMRGRELEEPSQPRGLGRRDRLFVALDDLLD